MLKTTLSHATREWLEELDNKLINSPSCTLGFGIRLNINQCLKYPFTAMDDLKPLYFALDSLNLKQYVQSLKALEKTVKGYENNQAYQDMKKAYETQLNLIVSEVNKCVAAGHIGVIITSYDNSYFDTLDDEVSETSKITEVTE